MGLVCKLERPVHVVETGLISLYFLIFFFCVFSSFFSWLYFLGEEIVTSEQFCRINFANFLQRDVGGLMLKTTVNIDVVAGRPGWMAESLNWVEFEPFRGLGIIYFKRYDLANRVRPATNDHHQRSQEQSWMLIPGDRTHGFILIRSFDPVPSSIPVPSKPPSIKQTALIGGSATEANHHSHGTSCRAEGSRVVYTHLRRLFSAVKLHPRKRRFLNAQTPNIIYCFLSGISSEH